MKKIEEIKNLREKNVEDLAKLVESSEQELMNLRFRSASGQLKQTAQLTAVRKRIARAKTILNEKNLAQ